MSISWNPHTTYCRFHFIRAIRKTFFMQKKPCSNEHYFIALKKITETKANEVYLQQSIDYASRKTCHV